MSKRGPVESLASLSRTTRPITRRTKSDNLSCSWCSRTIPPEADHVVLSPCKCTVCPRCLLHELAPRGNNEVQCLCCSSPICTHQYFESWLAQLPKATYQKPSAEPQVDDKLWLQQPMKCLTLSYLNQKELTPDEPFECIVLYGVRIVHGGGGDSKFDLQKCVVPFTFVGGVSRSTDQSAADCRSLESFCIRLWHCAAPHHTKKPNPCLHRDLLPRKWTTRRLFCHFVLE
jgi:hypothetical protein